MSFDATRSARSTGWGIASRVRVVTNGIHSLLPSWGAPTAPRPIDEEAFSHYAARMTRHQALLMSVMVALSAAAWWPLDHLVMPDQAHVDVFFWMRVGICVVMALSFAAFWTIRVSPRRTLAMAMAFYASFLLIVGLALGKLGLMSWLGDAYLGLIPMGFVLMPLSRRAVANVALASTLLIGFFAPYPANLGAPEAYGQLSFAVFAVLLSVATGEITYRSTRSAFFAHQALDRANGHLGELTETLEERVAEQTRELRALATHTSQLQEAERRRLARDLHDDLGQHLTAMRYTVSRIEEHVSSGADSDDTLMLIEDLGALLGGTAATMHGVVVRLRPRILDDLGLEAAVAWLCERTRASSGLPCALEVTPAFQAHAAGLDAPQALIMFRATQEAITNALKHAEPTALAVQLDATDDAATVTITDDGRGFQFDDPLAAAQRDEAQAGGFGLFGLRERVRSGAGSLTIRSSAGRGARLRVTLPLAAPAPSALRAELPLQHLDDQEETT